MYLPAQFKEDRPVVLRALMRLSPFATLVVPTDTGLEANLLPLLVRENEHGVELVGHVARSNPVWKRPVLGEALALFAGPEGYISPSTYASKQVDGKVVPTWNYVAVHAYGTLRWVEDDAWLAQMLEDLTNEHEAGRAEPWRVEDAPAAFTAGLRRAIVGLRLAVTRLEGKLKLGQNRPKGDRLSAIQGLRERGDEASLALAEAMQATLDG